MSRLDRRVSLVADRPRADVDAVLAVAAAPARPLRDALGPRVVVGKFAVLAARRPQRCPPARAARLALEAA